MTKELQKIIDDIEQAAKKQAYATTFIYCLSHKESYHENKKTKSINIKSIKQTVREMMDFQDLHEKCKTLHSDGCEGSDFGGAYTILEYLIDTKNHIM